MPHKRRSVLALPGGQYDNYQPCAAVGRHEAKRAGG